jgi:hypothetical protein
MAKAKNNVITRNYSGKVGNIILRVVEGLSVISAYPDYSRVKWSKKQNENRKQFRKASIWSKKVLMKPEMLEFYKSKAKARQNASNMAISDYLLNPEIRKIDVSKYKGQVGNTIKVSAYDKYKVASVIVMILNSTGFVLETGMASEYPYSGSGVWIYKAQVPNPDWRDCSVAIRVTDSPGKVFQSTISLNGSS